MRRGNSGYIADTEAPNHPPKPKPLSLHEEFHISNPSQFHSTLTLAIATALEKNPEERALIRARKYLANQKPTERGGLIKTILLASILFEKKLIENDFSPNFLSPEDVKAKLISLHDDVKDIVDGRVRRPIPETPEPTYIDLTFEILSTLGYITHTGAQLGLSFLKSTFASVATGAAETASNLYGSFFPPRPINTPPSSELQSDSWHIVPHERDEPLKSPPKSPGR